MDSDREAGKLLPVANKHVEAASVALKALQWMIIILTLSAAASIM